MANHVTIFSGNANRELAERIAKSYGTSLGKVTFSRFSDGEFQPSFEQSVRGRDIFIINSTFAPTENLFELLLMIDTAKRASARKIIAVVPYFGFARQDRKDKPRVPIGAKLVANLLTAAGVDRVVSMDLHADQIQGFFDVPFDHMYASSIFVPYLKKLDLPNLVIGAPDTGGAKRAAAYAKFLNTDLVICFKQRKKANEVSSMTVIGDVKNRDVVLVDDIVDTAGTLKLASEIIMDMGANSVRAMCTHGVLSGNAYKNIQESALAEMILTDTIPLKSNSCDKIKTLSTADLFADVINRIANYQSISEHFEFTTIL
ncbi:MAG: ribose-phosphate pyrophosphokinase [Bacteroidales bacterium]|nr:ribose-phosphate pyrophosphokinase [Bacteroidales bacterium]